MSDIGEREVALMTPVNVLFEFYEQPTVIRRRFSYRHSNKIRPGKNKRPIADTIQKAVWINPPPT